MVNTDYTQFTPDSTPQQAQQPSAQQPLSGVRQDKNAPRRELIYSSQPVTNEKNMRTDSTETKSPRFRKKVSDKRKTVPLMLWVKPILKEKLEQIAQRERLSVSATGKAFLEKSLQQHLDIEYAGLIQPVIEKAIKQEMQSYSNRLAFLLVRVAFASEQTRSIVTNILSRQSGITPETLTTILDGSSKTARRNISRRTPQLETIMDELEQMFTETAP